LPSTNLQRRSSLSSVPALLTSSAINRTPATAPAATHHPQRPHLRQQPRPAATPDTTTSSPRAAGPKREHGASHRRQRRQRVTEAKEARKKERKPQLRI